MESTQKTITARGYMTRLEYSGESFIESAYGPMRLSRDETLLWSCARGNVVTEAKICDVYYLTARRMGFAVADIGEVFVKLLKKNVISFGRDDNIPDAMYRMLCQGIFSIAGDIGYDGDNIAPVDHGLYFEPVHIAPTPIAMELWNDANVLAQRIATDEWTLPELVRNTEKGYPVTLTQDELFEEYRRNHPRRVISLNFFATEEQSLKDVYYKTDIGRHVAKCLEQLILAQRIVLL